MPIDIDSYSEQRKKFPISICSMLICLIWIAQTVMVLIEVVSCSKTSNHGAWACFDLYVLILWVLEIGLLLGTNRYKLWRQSRATVNLAVVLVLLDLSFWLTYIAKTYFYTNPTVRTIVLVLWVRLAYMLVVWEPFAWIWTDDRFAFRCCAKLNKSEKFKSQNRSLFGTGSKFFSSSSSNSRSGGFVDDHAKVLSDKVQDKKNETRQQFVIATDEEKDDKENGVDYDQDRDDSDHVPVPDESNPMNNVDSIRKVLDTDVCKRDSNSVELETVPIHTDSQSTTVHVSVVET